MHVATGMTPTATNRSSRQDAHRWTRAAIARVMLLTRGHFQCMSQPRQVTPISEDQEQDPRTLGLAGHGSRLSARHGRSRRAPANMWRTSEILAKVCRCDKTHPHALRLAFITPLPAGDLSLSLHLHSPHPSHRRQNRVEATSLACEHTHSASPGPRYASNISQKERHGQSAHPSPSPTRHRYRCHSKSALSTRHPNSSPSAEARVCEDCSTAA